LLFLKTLSQFRAQSSIKTWSLGIALNVVREMRRTRSHDAIEIAAAERASTELGEVGRAGSPVDSAASSELRSVLSAGLNDLSDRQREAVVLRFFEDLSVEQTASAMNCAPGTVKATVHQALRNLRRTLERKPTQST
jgi:RNA polymerase sigma factor (sigma-70 family)